MQNDEYTLDIEKLSNSAQIETIRETIMSISTPYAIGVSGRWGSGKTSVMRYLYTSIYRRDKA